MGRSVAVDLILDVSRYKRGGREATDVNKGLTRSTNEVAEAGDRAARAMARRTAKMSEATKAAQSLDRQIRTLTASQRDLVSRRALGEGGLDEILRKQQRQLRAFTKDRNLLGEPDEIASGFVAKLSARMGPLLASMPLSGPLGIAVAAGGAAVGPQLVSAMASGIAAGAGAGVLGAAVAVAFSKDAQLNAAGKQAGERLMQSLTRSVVSSGVRAELTQSLDVFEEAGQRFVSKFEVALRKLRPSIGPLTADLVSAFDAVSDAALDVAGDSGPALAGLGDSIRILGDGAADFMRIVADGGPAAAENMRMIAGATADAARFTGQLVKTTNELATNPFLTGILPLARKYYGDAAEGAKEAGDATRYFSGTLESGADKMLRLGGASKVGSDQLNVLLGSTGLVTDKMQAATQTATLMRQAIDAVSGAAIGASEANETYAAAWDGLSASVKENGRTLDINTGKGRSNRDALQALLKANNDSYVANIANGMSIDAATRKHQTRTTAIQKEADKAGLGKRETDKLIATYGRIPAKKGTDLFVQGFTSIERILADLYAFQRSLASGVSLGVARRQIASDLRGGYAGSASAFKADGGHIRGPGGPRGDKIPAMLSDYEYVVRADSTRKIGVKNLDYLNRYGEFPRFAAGGLAARDWGDRLRYAIDASGTRIPSRREVASKVTPSFGAWPSSPGAQRGDSGVWKQIVALVRGSGIPYNFGNGYRHGDPLWHGSGRAVDFMGYNQDRLAQFFLARQSKVLELIHRTNSRDYGVSRGRTSSMGRQWPLHRNHLHIAMRQGGLASAPQRVKVQVELVPGRGMSDSTVGRMLTGLVGAQVRGNGGSVPGLT